jgi:hypothetical protein
MLLENKNVVVYGAGGAVGGAVARGFAREGARVFLTGRNPGAVATVEKEISAAGGAAESAVVDALDEKSVSGHLGVAGPGSASRTASEAPPSTASSSASGQQPVSTSVVGVEQADHQPLSSLCREEGAFHSNRSLVDSWSPADSSPGEAFSVASAGRSGDPVNACRPAEAECGDGRLAGARWYR